MASVGASAGRAVLKSGAKRDPELYVLFAVMSGAFGLAGYYFGSKPTSGTSENKSINMAPNAMPWNDSPSGTTPREDFKYRYHPGGDARNPPREAPSALHSVVIPNVNLPKELHERFNKWGKDGF